MSRQSQGLKLDPSPNALTPVLQEPVELRDRNRLGLPTDIVKAAKWLEIANSKERYALGVLGVLGKIALLPWETAGTRVLQERTRLVMDNDLRSLQLLEDRYRRIQVAQDGRITLTLSFMLHLGLPIDADGIVHVIFLGDSIEIVSQSYRDQQIVRAATLFSDLP